MNKPLFNKSLYSFARMFMPAMAFAAILAHRNGYPMVCWGILGAALLLCIPTVLVCSHQSRCRYAQQLYGKQLDTVFTGKGQGRLRHKLVENIYLLDKSKKYRKAADKFEELEKECETDAEYAAVQMFLGDAYFGLGNCPEAEHFYRDALSHDGEYGMVWRCLGSMYSKLGRHEEAIECHLNAIKYGMTDAVSYNNLATAYYRCGRYDMCIEPCLQCLKLYPRYANAAWILSLSYYRVGNVEKSDEYYRMAGLLGANQESLDADRAVVDSERQAVAQAEAAQSSETDEKA